MKLSEVVTCIPDWYLASTEDTDSYTLTSIPGLGKTTTIETAPHLLTERFKGRYGMSVLNGGNMEVMDAQGYLIPRHREGYSDSVFTRPFWWTTREGKSLDEYDGGIVFVDEYDKAPVDVKKILGEGCYSKRLGAHTLPKGWCIWMAGNRGAQDRSGSTKELDHLINRTTFIEIEPDLESWTAWASANGATPFTIAFANNNPDIVFSNKLPDKQGPFCSPRSLMAADRYARRFIGKDGLIDLKNKLLFENIRGKIGDSAVVQWTNTAKLAQDMPKYETIIADPMKAKLPERPDACMLVCFNLAHRVTKEDADPICKYIMRMGKEFGVTFAKAACNRQAALVSTPAFQKWAMENAALMALIARK